MPVRERVLRMPRSEQSATAKLLSLLLGTCAVALVRGGWVDPDTPVLSQTIRSLKDGTPHYLVMSDEFDIENRTFRDGSDPVWTAIDQSDDAKTSVGEGSLMFYNHSMVWTRDGYLHINTSSEQTQWKGFNPYKKKYDIFHKDFKGGMIQSWNKFCFSGGIVEISVRLPGQYDVGGLWPAFWLMGNLGRAVYEHSTNMIWPWSYDKCNRDLQLAQEVNHCAKTRHWDLHANQGRGATEIDILEVMPGKAPPTGLGVGLPYVSTTLQLSPGVKENRPIPGKDLRDHPANWYKNLKFGPMTRQNQYFYGTLLDKTQKDEPAGRTIRQIYQADALSALTPLTKDHFDNFHKYRVEWMPGPNGYIAWYLDNMLLAEIDGASLDITGAQIPMEPSYLILNTAVSTTWGFPQVCPEGCSCQCFDCSKPECRCALPEGFCDMLPATMLVDYVRVYQLKNDTRQFVGCDHPTFPTKKFIKAHEWRYIRDKQSTPLLYVPKGFGKCKKDEDCKPGGTCDMRRKWCKCDHGWWGPDCKTRPYKDDDAPPKHLYLPIRWLDPPLSFQILAALFLIAVTMIVWKGGNANVAAGQGASAGRPGHRSGYSSIN